MNNTKESLILSGLYGALAGSMVVHSKNLAVETNQQANFIALSPRAHEDDKGKLIGDGGETFHAMKVLLGVTASRLGVRFHLARVKTDANTEKSDAPRTKPVNRRDWPKDELLALAVRVGGELFNYPPQVEWNHQSPEKSVLEIYLDPNEQTPVPLEVIQDCLDRVFTVIGTAKGHVLRVRLVKPQIKSDETSNRSNLRRADALYG